MIFFKVEYKTPTKYFPTQFALNTSPFNKISHCDHTLSFSLSHNIAPSYIRLLFQHFSTPFFHKIYISQFLHVLLSFKLSYNKISLINTNMAIHPVSHSTQLGHARFNRGVHARDDMRQVSFSFRNGFKDGPLQFPCAGDSGHPFSWASVGLPCFFFLNLPRALHFQPLKYAFLKKK